MNLPGTAVRTGAVALISLCVIFFSGCVSTRSDTRAADEAAIRKTDADWAKAGQSKQVDAWMAFYSSDAVILPPNDKAANSPDSIRKSISGLLGLPGLAITWQPTKVEVAQSGDLGYLYGAYEVSWDEPGGKRTTDAGKIVEIWKKQPDGSWKCIVDTWNSDLPAVPPSLSK